MALSGPATKPGAKGRSAIVFAQSPPPGALATAKLSLGCAAGLPDHGVIVVVAWLGPQVGGLVSTARAPPSKERSKEVNGTCGVSANVVVSWPVCGSARTLPTSRTEIP